MRKKILLPVVTGTVLSSGITTLLAWQGLIFPSEAPFRASVKWYWQDDLAAGAGLALMTALITGICLGIANRKRMK